ncbi:hypothetical protein H6G17_08835 [Chroococcidiopsis sp. FACHB-1243]|uniref:hypothetical protein n=1 Tax=Chroococcidiopsis sp. [FACHB-1243] TaxID=2692781 RepID=UPI001784807F|nr:hypothetical protein [Chroococcidiopsis sp. [FACHB-1243]]MBD2305621.1 hypothetical protein [Chroococcidiopsis sp. [FACHB-1243]]
MLKKAGSKQPTLVLRFDPRTIEAIVINYLRKDLFGGANLALFRALNAFYLPLAYLEVGKPQLQVERMATATINELLARVCYIQQTCLLDKHWNFTSKQSPTGMKVNLDELLPLVESSLMSKQVVLTLKADPATNDAITLDYCYRHKLRRSKQIVKVAMNAFYLPLIYLAAGASPVQIERVALAAIHELEAQLRQIQVICLPDIPIDVSSRESKKLIDSLPDSSLLTQTPKQTARLTGKEVRSGEIELDPHDSSLLNYVGGISSADLAIRADPFK